MTPAVIPAARSRVRSGRRPEPAGAGQLGNMSSRPTVSVVHPSGDPARQLVPAFRVRLVAADRPSRRRSGLPRPAGLPGRTVPADPDLARRRLEAIADAVPLLLDLPDVIPLAPGGALPDSLERTDPLLALALLARRSGSVWLGRRSPALDGLADGDSVTLLLPDPIRRRIAAAVDAPDWTPRVLALAHTLENSR